MVASGTGVADQASKLRLPRIPRTERRPHATHLLADSLAELDMIDRVLRQPELTLDRTRLLDLSFDADVRVSAARDSIAPVQEGASSRYACARGGERAR